MKKKIAFASMLTCLLLMATSLAFSQVNGQQAQPATASTKTLIESVVANSSHQCISVTFLNLNPKEEYHVLLYNAEKELLNSYWVDGNSMTLYVGPLAPSNYEVVLMMGKEVVDRKQMLLQ